MIRFKPSSVNSLSMSKMQLLLIFALLIASAYSLENLLETDFYECVKCLCHSVSGCWLRKNCAKYSIDQDYWAKAGSPTVDPSITDTKRSYQMCMGNENCIVNAIKSYTDRYEKDCNCDGKFDCKDRLAIHLGMANGCVNPFFTKIRSMRFNRCASKIGVQLMEVEEPYCDVPAE